MNKYLKKKTLQLYICMYIFGSISLSGMFNCRIHPGYLDFDVLYTYVAVTLDIKHYVYVCWRILYTRYTSQYLSALYIEIMFWIGYWECEVLYSDYWICMCNTTVSDLFHVQSIFWNVFQQSITKLINCLTLWFNELNNHRIIYHQTSKSLKSDNLT